MLEEIYFVNYYYDKPGGLLSRRVSLSCMVKINIKPDEYMLLIEHLTNAVAAQEGIPLVGISKETFLISSINKVSSVQV